MGLTFSWGETNIGANIVTNIFKDGTEGVTNNF